MAGSKRVVRKCTLFMTSLLPLQPREEAGARGARGAWAQRGAPLAARQQKRGNEPELAHHGTHIALAPYAYGVPSPSLPSPLSVCFSVFGLSSMPPIVLEFAVTAPRHRDTATTSSGEGSSALPYCGRCRGYEAYRA